MPKISKDMFTIKGELIPVEIHYNQKKGFFYEGLPDEFISLMNWNEERFYEESKMRNKLILALEEYHEKIKKIKKVIVYRLYGSLYDTKNQEKNGAFSGFKEGVSSKFGTTPNAPKHEFGFEYDVLLEVSGRTVQYHGIMPDGTPAREHKFIGGVFSSGQVMDWTQEREDFCKALVSKIQQLIYDVSNFFDNPQMLLLIDSGNSPLKIESGGKPTDWCPPVEDADYIDAE